MCGRFTRRLSWAELHELLDLIGAPVNLQPRYNIAPSQDLAVVRATANGRYLSMLRWGLIPSWAKDPAIGHKLINARAETAAEKPSFRTAFRHRRCLIPADGFYEWQRRGGARQPWLFGLRNSAPFAFAGLWERWTVPAGAPLPGSLSERSPGDALETCTILTTSANDTIAPVHGRMPGYPVARRLRPLACRRQCPAYSLSGARYDGASGKHARQPPCQRRPALRRGNPARLNCCCSRPRYAAESSLSRSLRRALHRPSGVLRRSPDCRRALPPCGAG